MTDSFHRRVQRGIQCDANMDMRWDCRAISGMYVYVSGMYGTSGSAAAVASQEPACDQRRDTRYVRTLWCAF